MKMKIGFDVETDFGYHIHERKKSERILEENITPYRRVVIVV